MLSVKHESSLYMADSQAGAPVLEAPAVDGAPGRIRTGDEELSRDPLYPLSYRREVVGLSTDHPCSPTKGRYLCKGGGLSFCAAPTLGRLDGGA